MKMMYLILFVFLLSPVIVNAQFVWMLSLSDTANGRTYKFNSIVSSDAKNITILGFTNVYGGMYSQLLLRSENCGESWTEYNTGIPNFLTHTNGPQLRHLFAYDSSHIYAVGDSGYFTYSSTGGRSWEMRKQLSHVRLNDIAFIDTAHGIVVGDKGKIFVTSNSGHTWDTIESSSKRSLKKCLAFVGGKYLVFEQSNGRMYRSNNFGKSWDTTLVYNYVTSNYQVNDVNFIDSLHGVLVGTAFTQSVGTYNALIMKTVDGGNTWSVILDTSNHDKLQDLFSVAFLTENIGITVGRGQYSFVTIDGGNNWDYHNNDVSKIGEYHTSIVAIDNKKLFCVGAKNFSAGYVYRVDLGSNDTRKPLAYKTVDSHLYPNPSTGIVNVTSLDDIGAGITIVDILGREVYRGKLSGDGTTSVDLRHLPKGIYYVVFTHDGKEFIAGKVALTIE